VCKEYKLKPQWDIISYMLEWVLTKKWKTTNIGNKMEKGKPHTMLVRLQINTQIMGKSMEISASLKTGVP
jgi:hypothetical protein